MWGDDINALICIFTSTVQDMFVENYETSLIFIRV